MTEEVRGFKLIQLPALARQYVMRHMKHIELFELSLCSFRMARYVRELRIEAESHNIVLTQGQSTVSVSFINKQNKIWWDFQTFFPRKNMIQSRKIGNVFFDTCERNQAPLGIEEYYCDFEENDVGAAAVSKHFQYLFPGPLNLIISPTIHNNLDVLFAEPELQKIQTLELTGADTVLKWTLKSIFEKMTVAKKLVIKPNTDQGYIIEQAFTVDELNLRCSTWMTQEHLLQIDCRIAHLGLTLFESDDIEKLAKKWLINKQSRIERIRIEWNTDFELQLGNLPTKEWDVNRREAHFIYYQGDDTMRIDCSNGYDLERDDGMLATIVPEDIDGSLYIWFLVWHESFPEKKRLDDLPGKLLPYYQKLERLNKNHPEGCSLERLLSRRDLKISEFMETLQIFKNIDADNRNRSPGTICRKDVFEQMSKIINLRI